MSAGGTLFNWAAYEQINDALAQYEDWSPLKCGQELNKFILI